MITCRDHQWVTFCRAIDSILPTESTFKPARRAEAKLDTPLTPDRQETNVGCKPRTDIISSHMPEFTRLSAIIRRLYPKQLPPESRAHQISVPAW